MPAMKDREELKTSHHRLERGDGGAQVDVGHLVRRRGAAGRIRCEQEQVAEGLPHEAMRGLCASHRAAAAGSRDAFRAGLSEAHPLAVLMDEHVRILAHLDELERLVHEPVSATELARLRSIEAVADSLIGAEPHHQREENVLFPELCRRGLQGPPAVMQAEHVELRALKHSVKLEACLARDPLGDVARARLRTDALRLITMLREHIGKEDGILYPLALETIREPDAWEGLRRRCEEIGPCADAQPPGDRPCA